MILELRLGYAFASLPLETTFMQELSVMVGASLTSPTLYFICSLERMGHGFEVLGEPRILPRPSLAFQWASLEGPT